MTDRKFRLEDRADRPLLSVADVTHVSIPIAHSVISSGAEGVVEKSLDFTCLVTHQHQDLPNVGSID